MANPNYRPTLVWGGDSLVWASRTLSWDQFQDVLPGEFLMVKEDRARRLEVKADRARNLTVKADRARVLMVKQARRVS